MGDNVVGDPEDRPHPGASRSVAGVPLRIGDLSRLRDPHRALAVAIIGLVGGLMVMCLAVHRDGAGADALAYWQGVRTWLAGGDPYQPAGPWWPYVYAFWMLPLFVPWALLPWPIAWALWRGAMILLVAWSLAWAYEKRPLAAALAFLVVSIPLGVVLDSANISLFLTFALWAMCFTGPRTGGLLWAFATATKWFPAVALPMLTPAGRRWGLAFIAVAAVLYLATWPMTVEQLEVVGLWGVPSAARGVASLRVDHLIFLWAVVPWLWGARPADRRGAAVTKGASTHGRLRRQEPRAG